MPIPYIWNQRIELAAVSSDSRIIISSVLVSEEDGFGESS